MRQACYSRPSHRAHPDLELYHCRINPCRSVAPCTGTQHRRVWLSTNGRVAGAWVELTHKMHLYRIDTFFLGPDFHPKCEFPWGPRRRIGAQRNQMLNLPSHSTKQVAKLHPVGAGRPKPKTNMSHVTYPAYSIGGNNGLLLTCLDPTLFFFSLWWLQWLQWPWRQVCHIQGKPMPFLRITPSFISAWLLAAEEKRAHPEAVIMESLVCGIWPMRALQPEPADTFYDLDDFVFAWFCDRLAADEEVMEEEICNFAKIGQANHSGRSQPTILRCPLHCTSSGSLGSLPLLWSLTSKKICRAVGSR